MTPVVQYLSSVASSSDGSHIVAATARAGELAISSDYGATWSFQVLGLSSFEPAQYVASSADGSHLVAVQNVGDIFTSNSYGNGGTWVSPREFRSMGGNRILLEWVASCSRSRAGATSSHRTTPARTGQIEVIQERGCRSRHRPMDAARRGPERRRRLHINQLWGILDRPGELLRKLDFRAASSSDGTRLLLGNSAGGVYTGVFS